MDSELLDYKNELHLDIDITAEVERVFSDTAFFQLSPSYSKKLLFWMTFRMFFISIQTKVSA